MLRRHSGINGINMLTANGMLLIQIRGSTACNLSNLMLSFIFKQILLMLRFIAVSHNNTQSNNPRREEVAVQL